MKYAMLFTLLSLLTGYTYTPREAAPGEWQPGSLPICALQADAKLDTTEPCGDQPEIIID